MISIKLVEKQEWQLTEEGQMIAKEGSHEAKVFYSLPAEGISQKELQV